MYKNKLYCNQCKMEKQIVKIKGKPIVRQHLSAEFLFVKLSCGHFETASRVSILGRKEDTNGRTS